MHQTTQQQKIKGQKLMELKGVIGTGKLRLEISTFFPQQLLEQLDRKSARV